LGGQQAATRIIAAEYKTVLDVRAKDNDDRCVTTRRNKAAAKVEDIAVHIAGRKRDIDADDVLWISL
jgi:hypothetical protein